MLGDELDIYDDLDDFQEAEEKVKVITYRNIIEYIISKIIRRNLKSFRPGSPNMKAHRWKFPL